MRQPRPWCGVLAAALVAASTSAGERLPEESCGGLYWDLTAVFDAGDRIYARVLVTNEGPGEHNALGLGHWIDPEGRVTEFRNGRRWGRWRLEADGRRLHVGSTVLDRSGPTRRFEVDNDKRGVKIHLALGPAGLVDREALDGRYSVAVEALGAPASGTAWRSGMETPRPLSGWASLVRTRHRACERDLGARRLDLHVRGEDGTGLGTLLLVHLTAPDGAPRAWLGRRSAGGALQATTDVSVALSATPSPGSDYPLPASLEWSSPILSGRIVLKTPHLSIHPLDALPRLAQMLYWLRSRPQRVWSDAVEIGLKEGPESAVLRMRGAAVVASTTFLRPQAE